MNSHTTFIIVSGRDGGLVIYEPNDAGDQPVVFAGNVKEATEYFGTRATSLAAGDKPKQSPSIEPVNRPQLPRRLLSPRGMAEEMSATLADQLDSESAQ